MNNYEQKPQLRISIYVMYYYITLVFYNILLLKFWCRFCHLTTASDLAIHMQYFLIVLSFFIENIKSIFLAISKWYLNEFVPEFKMTGKKYTLK